MAQVSGDHWSGVRSNAVPGIQTNLAWDALLDPGGQPPGPLHSRLTGALRAAIRSGRIGPGSALPPSRLLASELGCSRWAVTEAYQQLTAEGYVESQVGSGTRVVWQRQGTDRPLPPVDSGPRADRRLIDLAPGLPDLRLFPLDRWLAALRTAASGLPFRQLGYPTPGGEPQLREVLAEYLYRVRGAATRAADLSICGSVTDAVVRLCLAARAAGLAAVAVEDPGWTRLRDTVRATGLEVVPIPVDDQGMRVDLLDRHPEVGMVIVSPAHQFPTGVVLAPQRRTQLLEWARRVDGLIIEDDYDAEFRYDRRPVGTLQGIDPERVALAGSLSKTLSPALGIGWMATPERWTFQLSTRAPGPGVLDQLALAGFISSGGYDRHLRSARSRYRQRRDALVSALHRRLPRAKVGGAAAGLHLLLEFPDSPALDAPAVVRRAADLGLELASARQYRVTNTTLDSALVLGYGNLRDTDVPVAVARLAGALSDLTR